MAGMGTYVLMAASICALWRGTGGAAYFEPLSSETTMYGSRPVTKQYCAWQGKKMMIGSNWKTTSCETCSCDDSGMTCYGHGLYAIPPGCMLLIDEDCNPAVVQTANPWSPCDSNSAITG